MSLELYVANDLRALAKEMVENIRKQTPDIFRPVYIVTQTEGMNNWLRLQFADKNNFGIAANILFLKPNEFLQKVYQFAGGSYTETFNRDNMCWLIYSILGTPDFLQKYPDKAAYFYENKEQSAIRKLSLAQNLADLFDQYQIYRPDYIEKWNQHHEKKQSPENWQEYIWIQAAEKAGESLPDKTKIGKAIPGLLRNPDTCSILRQKMPVAHVFGISILTPFHLKLSDRISEVIDLKFYTQNPAPGQYWFDTVSEKQEAILISKGLVKPGELAVGNSLLTNWGKVAKDTFSLFFQNEKMLNAYTEIREKEPEPGSLLHSIQAEIFNNLNHEESAVLHPEKLRDGSIVINSCFSIAREVEVLYNYLVHLSVEKKGELAPSDIVVMTSDIDAYAPYIKAVFNHAPYPFRYSITDETFTGSDNIITALSSVLELSEHDFTSEKIMQLLEMKYIRKRFGFTDIFLVRQALRKANICFGIDGETENETRYVSWQYGLKRLIFGICMADEELFYDGEEALYPVMLAEGNDSLEMIRLHHFIEELAGNLKERKNLKPVGEWVNYVRKTLRTIIYEPEGASEEDFQALDSKLEDAAMIHELADEKIPYEVFASYFIKTLQSVTKTSFFARGGITFCSMIPMRSIPFKVVAMLGMDFDKFPRKNTPQSFNLLSREKRRGDRNIRDNDKHLFLENLISARENLYISYLGQSIKDNSLRPPSALVDELLDYLDKKFSEENVRENFISLHPMHGFSRKYNNPDYPFLVSYINYQSPETRKWTDRHAPEKEFDFSEIDLKDLIAFFKHSFKHYYQHVLDIYYDNKGTLLPETEKFELDNLEKWTIRNGLLAHTEGVSSFREKWVKQGRLPLKNAGYFYLKKLEEEVRSAKNLFSELTQGLKPGRTTIEIPMDEKSILKGTIEEIFEDRLVSVCFSGNETKYRLEAWIKHLAGTAAGKVSESYLISGKKDKKLFKAPHLTKEEALDKLKKLVDFYKEGFSRMPCCYTGFNIKAAEEEVPKKNFHDSVKAVFNNYDFPCEDEHLHDLNRLGYFEKEETLADFNQYFKIILKPLETVFQEYAKKQNV